MFTLDLPDSGHTQVTIDGTLNPALPLVVLLHGVGGDSQDFTAPEIARAGTAYARDFIPPSYHDEGWRPHPPFGPVAGLFLDPPRTSLTSWNTALIAAGFTTVTYTEATPSGLIAPNVAQLTLLALALNADSRLATLPVAFVAHSRGGLIARSFLVAAAANPMLATFLGRVKTLITLHSPHAGSMDAGIAVTVDGMLASLQTALAAGGLPPMPILALLRKVTASPAYTELVPGNPTLAAIAAAEPVPGVVYHTFGGTSTDFARLWASFFTPDSTVPMPVPFPLFHWGSTPVVVGTPLNVASFVPGALLTQLPVVTEIITTLAALAATTDELKPGAGDLFVSDARARLPFAASHRSNPLNHAEALWDPSLQAQVVALLNGLRNPLISGHGSAKLSPFPAHTGSGQYAITAHDTITGVSITPTSVTVYDNHGNEAFTHSLVPPADPHFTFSFTSRTVKTFDGESRTWDTEKVWPYVTAYLGPAYGSVEVNTGLQ